MKATRFLCALLCGAGVTLIQFVAVGALNRSSSQVRTALDVQRAKPAMIVTEPPVTRKVPPRKPEAVRTRTARSSPSPKTVRRSALPPPNLKLSHLALGSSLPDISEVGLGQLDVPQVTTEPDRPARAKRTAQPWYPSSAQRDGVEGYVTVRLDIDADGRVKNVIVVDSEPLGVFEQSAREAARRFEFVPARVSGKAVKTTVEKTVVFELR